MAHYTCNSTALFQAALQQRFFTIDQCEILVEALSQVTYGVIDSQRDGFTALNTFIGSGVKGKNLFTRSKRFPETDEDIYLSMYDHQVQRTLTALSTVLSFRLTNVAKDTNQGVTAGSSRGGGNASGQDYKDVANDQATQDNTKRFEELRRQFCGYLNDNLRLKNQHSVERDLSLHWHTT